MQRSPRSFASTVMLTIRQTYKRIPKKSELLFVYNALVSRGEVEPHEPLQVCYCHSMCPSAPLSSSEGFSADIVCPEHVRPFSNSESPLL